MYANKYIQNNIMILLSPNEIKLKYFSENKFKNLHGEKLNEAMREEIKAKDKNTGLSSRFIPTASAMPS